MDRTQLFDTLSNLPPAAFERLLIAVNMPRMNRAGASTEIGEQVSALLEWADSAIGPGVEAIAHHLTKLHRFEFDAYLRSLVATYEKWWEHYTLTDAVGKVEQPALEKPSVFDFGLMVQTVTKEREPTDPENTPLQQGNEKTERLPVLEGIRKYADDHVLLVGRPGSGKSTALIRLLLEEATLSPDPSAKVGRKEPERIVVLVELRYWQTSVLERIRAFLYQHDPYVNSDNATLNALLRQGRFLLLIDGLNELPSDEARTQLATFRRDHPKVPMIFTTRDLGLGGDLGIKKQLEMQPLTEAQIKEFVRTYVPDQAEAMLRQLNERLREFGQTPLLLWMLCEVFQQSPNRQMPTNLAEVFRKFTEAYEKSAIREHQVAALKGDVRPLSDRRLWKEALKALAALMMQGETPVDFRVAIHRDEAERELGELFAKERFPVRDILDDLLKYHLLQNRTTDQLEFRHQLIQEYYAAEYLLSELPKLSDEQLKRDHLNYLKWTESIALMLALVDKEAQALWVVKLAMDDVDLMLSSRLAGEVSPTLQPTTISWINTLGIPIALKIRCWAMSRSEAAIPILRQALEHQNFDVRESVAETLAELDSKAVTPGLLRSTEHQNSDVRRRAAETLGELRSKAAIRGLLQALKHQNTDVRRRAAEALGQMGSEAAIPVLLQALEHQNSSVRRRAAEALGELGSEAAILGLRQALEHQNSDVRWSAATVLREMGSEAAIPILRQVLEHQNSSVRRRAAEALGELGSEAAIAGLRQALEHQNSSVRRSAAEALGELGSEVAIPILRQALEHQNSSVRRSAAEALGELGSEVAIPILRQALEHLNSDVRMSAAEALGELGSEAAISGLLQALEHQNSDVRMSAAEALGKIGSEAAIPGLRQALEHPNSDVRMSAAEALGKIGSEAAISGLLQALKDQHDFVRWSVAEALGKIGSEAAISGLLQALKDQHDFVRWRAAEALGKIGSEAAISGLCQALEDENFDVCKRAAEALGQINSEAAILALNQALEHQNSDVRRSAAAVLGKIGSEAVIPGLRQALEHPDSDVRRRAAETLGKMGSKAAISGLLQALEHPDSDVRRRAAEALGQMGSEAAIPVLLQALEHPDSDVRWSATEALGKIGSEAVISGLLQALRDPKNFVRKSAAEALVKIGSEAAISGLRQALEYPDFDVRRRAAGALGKIGSAVTITDLWQLHLRQPEDCLEKAISAIQDRCKFYNYDIWKESIQNAKLEIQNKEGTGNGEIHQHFYGSVFGVAGNVEGNQIISPESTS